MVKNLSKNSIKIICPSYRRAGKTLTDKIFGERLVFAVHPCDAEAYEQAYPNNEIMLVPEMLEGNMARVRNYIRNLADAEYIVMVDDDIKTFGYFEKLKWCEIPDILDFFIQGFILAEDSNTMLWGINITDQRNAYHEQMPFCFCAPVLGTFCGIINRDFDIEYDERLGLNEDYDFFLQVIKKYKRVLRFNKYFYVADHLKKDGGCQEYRTHETEVEQAEIMIDKWGDFTVSYDFERSYNPKIRFRI